MRIIIILILATVAYVQNDKLEVLTKQYQELLIDCNKQTNF